MYHKLSFLLKRMSQYSRRKAVIVVLGTLLLLSVMGVILLPHSKHTALSPLQSAPPAKRPAQYSEHIRVLTDNIGDGSECDQGNTGAYDCLSFVNAQIKSYDPSAISVDEVCQSVYESFQTTHPDWTVNYGADAVPDIKKCGYQTIDGRHVAESHGNFAAVASRQASRTSFVLAANPRDKDTYRLICVQTTELAANFWMCTVHLPYRASNATRLTQVNDIVADVNNLSGAVTIGGDFNMNQNDPAISPLRAAGYIETDPTDKPTSRGNTGGITKFDFIWYRADRHLSQVFTNPSGVVIQQPPADFDHNMLEGSVTLSN